MPHARPPVMLFGATGTIGRATHQALRAAGHPVIAPVRTKGSDIEGAVVSAFDTESLTTLMRGAGCRAVISCLASRTGASADAWAVDHALNSLVLQAALKANVTQFVLLSAICVQRPKLGFQQAKLAFETELQAAPITWSIVRPTAFFKSLSGQMQRLKNGKPFLVFGDGQLTACKPISDTDLGRYLTGCLTEPDRQNRVLPIGGPGPALTPLQQGALLFDALGQKPRFKHVPVALMSGIIGGLSVLGRITPRLADKAEFARIGRYYATESMLLWDSDTQRYDADRTPEFGSDRLADHYAKLAAGEITDDRGAHAVF